MIEAIGEEQRPVGMLARCHSMPQPELRLPESDLCCHALLIRGQICGQGRRPAQDGHGPLTGVSAVHRERICHEHRPCREQRFSGLVDSVGGCGCDLVGELHVAGPVGGLGGIGEEGRVARMRERICGEVAGYSRAARDTEGRLLAGCLHPRRTGRGPQCRLERLVDEPRALVVQGQVRERLDLVLPGLLP